MDTKSLAFGNINTRLLHHTCIGGHVHNTRVLSSAHRSVGKPAASVHGTHVYRAHDSFINIYRPHVGLRYGAVTLQ